MVDAAQVVSRGSLEYAGMDFTTVPLAPCSDEAAASPIGSEATQVYITVNSASVRHCSIMYTDIIFSSAAELL